MRTPAAQVGAHRISSPIKAISGVCQVSSVSYRRTTTMFTVVPKNDLVIGDRDFGVRIDPDAREVQVSPQLASILRNFHVYEADEFVHLVHTLPTPLAMSLGWTVDAVRDAGVA